MSHCPANPGKRNVIAAPVSGKEFTEEMKRIKRDFDSAANEVRDFRKQMTEKYDIYSKLCANQEQVSDVVDKYNIIRWSHFACHPESPARQAIDEEMKVHIKIMEDWKLKLDAAGAIFRNYFSVVETHLCALNSIMEVVKDAKSVNDLQNISIPSSDGIRSVPDPKIEDFSNEWSQMDLSRKISNCFDQLQQLNPPKSETGAEKGTGMGTEEKLASSQP